jgi:hypothetical protein
MLDRAMTIIGRTVGSQTHREMADRRPIRRRLTRDFARCLMPHVVRSPIR